jgi:hypothetical protein
MISAMSAGPTGQFVTVARVGDIPSGNARQVTVDGRWVALFHIDGAYHAITTCVSIAAGRSAKAPSADTSSPARGTAGSST